MTKNSFKLGGVEVTHLTHDSRTARAGSCFFALPGTKTDGAVYVMQAVANGASIIVAQRGSKVPDVPVPVLFVDDVRETMSLASKRFYNDICDKMNIIGVTGTNGKTTCTYILRGLCGRPRTPSRHIVGVIGTLGAFIGDDCISKSLTTPERNGQTHIGHLTTPDPIELHEIFYTMYKRGVRTVIMEVSAHAIHYKKVAGINFRAGIFTNLTQDHLDFFNTMDEYAKTKANFMTGAQVQTAVINIDDPYGQDIYLNCESAESYSINDAIDLEMSQGHNSFNIGKHRLDMNLAGRFNVMNALACIKVARILGITFRKIKKRLATVEPVSGRFNVYKSKKGFSIIIDYAHTPDGIEKILTSARELVSEKGKLIAVFGCGGNRDKTKREIMGKLAGNLADFAVVTSDNPRDESPEAIMLQIEAGVKATDNKNYKLLEDRMEAIYFAFDMASEGDVVVIAGKGAETTQEIAGIFHPYSDIETVKDYISKGN
ncbi:MAG: UDP-N-acetylmuramoyl-L-alanyl-D-glutamate--2,6-diaminopimelate ligase [Christensenellaceae bacterium]|jgi:UDP-N-acetylmuramoyl-L-alanyl-D-glutamate--2,6-diaminopimelate ligase|nr:UDP-N-acetylmuramoyl-L-alanyl-D-glutamate--2,6-diaminopimelate ligase [Christensenellaceae bacterium]